MALTATLTLYDKWATDAGQVAGKEDALVKQQDQADEQEIDDLVPDWQTMIHKEALATKDYAAAIDADDVANEKQAVSDNAGNIAAQPDQNFAGEEPGNSGMMVAFNEQTADQVAQQNISYTFEPASEWSTFWQSYTTYFFPWNAPKAASPTFVDNALQATHYVGDGAACVAGGALAVIWGAPVAAGAAASTWAAMGSVGVDLVSIPVYAEALDGTLVLADVITVSVTAQEAAIVAAGGTLVYAMSKPDIEFIRYIQKKYGLSDDQATIMHDEIDALKQTGEKNLSKEQIEEIAQEVLDMYPNK